MLGMPPAPPAPMLGPMAERDTSDQRGTTAIDWVMLAALAFSVVVLATTFGGTWFGGVA